MPICSHCGRTSNGNAPCMECPRASVMPPNVAPIDPHFYDAAFREFSPAEKEMVEEKVELPERLRSKGAL